MDLPILLHQSFIEDFKQLQIADQKAVLSKIPMLKWQPFFLTDAAAKLRQIKGTSIYKLHAHKQRVIYLVTGDGVELFGILARKNEYINLAPRTLSALNNHREMLVPFDDWLHTFHTEQVAVAVFSTALPTATVDAIDSLPAPITQRLLRDLNIPLTLHQTLIGCQTLDALIASGVSPEIYESVFDRLLGQAVIDHQVPEEVAPILNWPAAFLQPPPEERRHWERARTVRGPALVKGEPSTGLLAIAMQRTRLLLARLQAEGIARPRILFAINGEVRSHYARHVLDALLGADGALVEVWQPDKLAQHLNYDKTNPMSPLQAFEEFDHLWQLGKKQQLPLRMHPSAAPIAAMRSADIYREMAEVIAGRNLLTLEAYRQTTRRGRARRLSHQQRAAIWFVWEQYLRALNSKGLVMQDHIYAWAAGSSGNGRDQVGYDAVIVHDLQALHPIAVHFLVGLARQSTCFFATMEVDDLECRPPIERSRLNPDLHFRGRCSLVHQTNQERSIAISAYLAGSEQLGTVLQGLERTEQRTNKTAFMAARRLAITLEDERDQVAAFIQQARNRWHWAPDAVAVFCPTAAIAKQFARQLQESGIAAKYQASSQRKWHADVTPVMPLIHAQSMPFPGVVLAGFTQWQPALPDHGASAPYPPPVPLRQRIGDAMRCAQHALLFVVPAHTDDPLFSAGFSPQLWDM